MGIRDTKPASDYHNALKIAARRRLNAQLLASLFWIDWEEYMLLASPRGGHGRVVGIFSERDDLSGENQSAADWALLW